MNLLKVISNCFTFFVFTLFAWHSNVFARDTLKVTIVYLDTTISISCNKVNETIPINIYLNHKQNSIITSDVIYRFGYKDQNILNSTGIQVLVKNQNNIDKSSFTIQNKFILDTKFNLVNKINENDTLFLFDDIIKGPYLFDKSQPFEKSPLDANKYTCLLIAKEQILSLRKRIVANGKFEENLIPIVNVSLYTKSEMIYDVIEELINNLKYLNAEVSIAKLK